jgi:hypothetical protein
VTANWSRLRGGGNPEDQDAGDVAYQARQLAEAILSRRRGLDRHVAAAVYEPLPDDHDDRVRAQTTQKEWNR